MSTSTRNRKPQGYELPNGDYYLGSEKAEKAYDKRRARIMRVRRQKPSAS